MLHRVRLQAHQSRQRHLQCNQQSQQFQHQGPLDARQDHQHQRQQRNLVRNLHLLQQPLPPLLSRTTHPSPHRIILTKAISIMTTGPSLNTAPAPHNWFISTIPHFKFSSVTMDGHVCRRSITTTGRSLV